MSLDAELNCNGRWGTDGDLLTSAERKTERREGKVQKALNSDHFIPGGFLSQAGLCIYLFFFCLFGQLALMSKRFCQVCVYFLSSVLLVSCVETDLLSLHASK